MTRETAPVTEERLRDADRSQNTILAAARDEFAEFGMGGARMDRIAERAGLNKRLIYYYFEDKEKLFEAVLEQSGDGARLMLRQAAMAAAVAAALPQPPPLERAE